MARLILVLAVAALAAAAVIWAVSMLATAWRGLERDGAGLSGKDGMRNVIYVALFVLLLGVTTGLIGGL